MTRVRPVIFLSTLLGLLILTGSEGAVGQPTRHQTHAGASSSRATLPTVKFGMFTQASLILVAQKEGDFANLNVKEIPQQSGGAALSLILGGALDGQGDIAAVPVNIAIDKKVPVKIVWINSKAPTQVVVRSDISVPNGLKGKKIASPSGSIDDFLLEDYLKSLGVLSDVQIVDLDPASMVAAFKTHQIDGVGWSPPVSTVLISSGGKLLKTNLVPVFTVFSTTFIQKHHSDVQTFICDLAKTHQRFADQAKSSSGPTAWQDLAKILNLKLADVKTVMPVSGISSANQITNPTWKLGAPEFVNNILHIGAALAKVGGISKPPTKAQVNAMFDPEFAQAVANGQCGK
jgi:ABC-type nitrate/sulfonate/bicarbonate transport system substrate-binding protein